MRTMYLTPYRRAHALRRAMDSLFDESLVRPTFGNGSLNLALDVQELPEEYVVRANVPGLPAEALSIDVLDNVVTIKGELTTDETDESGEVLVRERRSGAFSRTLTLPVAVDADQSVADLKDGVLTLRIGKAEQAKPHKIQISAN